MISNIIKPNEVSGGAVNYVDSSRIVLNDLSWSVTSSGMAYADASSYVSIPSNAKIVSSVLTDWGNLDSNIIIQAYVDSGNKLCLMCNQSTWQVFPYVIFRVFYTV